MHEALKPMAPNASFDFKLIFQLSLFGLVMAFATVFVVPPQVEPVLWLGIFLFIAVVLAKKAPSKAPLHGLLVSLCNSVYITLAHVAFAERYIAGHPDEAAAGQQFGLPVRLMMLVTGPIVGLLSGLLLAFMTYVATRIVKRPARA